MTIRADEVVENGVRFFNIRSSQKAAGSACIGAEKVIIEGYPKVTLMNNLGFSYPCVGHKYNTEIQISVHCHKSAAPLFKDRNTSQYNSIEICMRPDIAMELAAALLKYVKVSKGVFK